MLSLAFVVMSSVAHPAQDGELHPRCSWAREGASVVFDGLSSCGSDELLIARAADDFQRHAYQHGWNLLLPQDEPCPAHLLDLMTSLAMPCNRDSIDDLHVQVAHVLERNGRIDDAVAVLDAAFESLRRRGGESRTEYSFEFDLLPTIAQAAAELCERVGRYERALHYASEWTPPTFGCGNCIDGVQARIQSFVARCLVGANRWDEARTLCISNLASSGVSHPCIVESWIDASLAMGEADEPDVAVAQLANFLDSNERRILEYGVAHWRMLHLPPEAQLAELGKLSWSHRKQAFARIAKLDDVGLARLCSAFDVVDGSLKDEYVAELLSQTGANVVGAAIAYAEGRLTDTQARERFKSMREGWESVHDQLRVLRNP